MPLPPVTAPRAALVFLCIALLAGCSTIKEVAAQKDKLVTAVSPYKIDIIQGNVVTREQVDYLRPGMSRAQVRDVLGSALLTSVFHADRWDYIFTLQRQGSQPQSRKVTVFFKNDVLERVEADDVPSEKEFVSTLRSTPPKGPLPVLEMPRDAIKAVPTPSKPAPVAPAATPPVDATNYPPLEPAQ